MVEIKPLEKQEHVFEVKSSSNREESKPLRIDITHRGLLRMIRRFFYNLYKKDNVRLFNKRFTKVPVEETLNSLEDFVKTYLRAGTGDYNFEENFERSMAEFMFQFFKLKSCDKLPAETEGIANGNKIYK